MGGAAARPLPGGGPGLSRYKSKKRPSKGRHALDGGRDAELESGSDAHYTDAAYYAATYADRSEDVDFYLGLAAEHGEGGVLEYGCGDGRILLPMARIGLTCTGVDRSAPMLRALRKKLKAQPTLASRVTVKRGDMRRVRLDRRFPLVLCTFNTFLHLYTRQDVEQFLARVRDHLGRGGLFVVDVSVPNPEELDRDPSKLTRVSPFKHPTTGEVVRYGERFDYDPMRQVLLVGMEFEPKGAPERAWMTPLAHRQFFPRELEALLHYNGFEVTDVYGDFEMRAPDADTVDIALVCRTRRGWKGL